MQRFLISTITLCTTLFIILSTAVPVLVLAQTSNIIRVDDKDYTFKKNSTHAARQLNLNLKYSGYWEYQMVTNYDLQLVATGAASPVLPGVLVNRFNNDGTYSVYNKNIPSSQGLSSPLRSLGTTTQGFSIYEAKFTEAILGTRKIAQAKNNSTRFYEYDPSEHGELTPVTNPNNSIVPSPTAPPQETLIPGQANLPDLGTFAKLPNPLGGAGINTTGDAIDKITTIVMIIAVPFVTIMIMYAGFSYIAAYGNPEKLRAANKRALWTLVGTMLLFGATTIGNAIIKTIQKITSDGAPASTTSSTGTSTSLGSGVSMSTHTNPTGGSYTVYTLNKTAVSAADWGTIPGVTFSGFPFPSAAGSKIVLSSSTRPMALSPTQDPDTVFVDINNNQAINIYVYTGGSWKAVTDPSGIPVAPNNQLPNPTTGTTPTTGTGPGTTITQNSVLYDNAVATFESAYVGATQKLTSRQTLMNRFGTRFTPDNPDAITNLQEATDAVNKMLPRKRAAINSGNSPDLHYFTSNVYQIFYKLTAAECQRSLAQLNSLAAGVIQYTSCTSTTSDPIKVSEAEIDELLFWIPEKQ